MLSQATFPPPAAGGGDAVELSSPRDYRDDPRRAYRPVSITDAKAARPGRRSLLGPLLLFGLLGYFYTLPPQGGDRRYAVSAIVEARNALLEGQFPLRVAPTLAEGARTPVFQFYGNFPFTLAGALTFLPFDVDAYEAWKIAVFLLVTCGGFYAYRCGLTLTRQTWPSVVAGAVFVAAPYLSTDFRARFAYTEAVSFCLLPPVLYYSLRAFISPKRGAILAGGVFWALLALSHNITYLYASALIGLLFLSFVSLNLWKYVRRMFRVGLAYGLGALLVLWYVVPQLELLDMIGIAVENANYSPIWSTRWGPIDALLWPVMRIAPSAMQTRAMSVQVGWPILAVVLLSAVLIVRAAVTYFRRPRRTGLGRPGGRLIAAFLLAWAISFFIVWSPVDFWKYVPGIFYNVQILYRILMFVVLWGSVLAALSLAELWRRRAGGMPAPAGFLCLLVVAVAGMPFQGWALDPFRQRIIREITANPDFGAEIVYRPVMSKIAEHRIKVPADAKLLLAPRLAGRVRFGPTSRLRFNADEPHVLQLPIVFYPRGVLEVRDRGRRLTDFGHIDGKLAVKLPSGNHHLHISFVGVRWANWVSGLAWVGVGAASVALLVVRRRRRSERIARAGFRRGDPYDDVTERRPGGGPRPPAAFPVPAAALAAVVLIVPLSLPAAYVRWEKARVLHAAGQLTVSSEANSDVRAIHAFDGNPGTVWAASNSDPGWLITVPPKPRHVSVVELEPREVDRYAGWHEVEVILHNGGQVVSRQHFSLPDAWKQPLHVLKLDKPATADKIELRFSDPVTLTITGTTHIDRATCYPGYREIRFR